MKVIPREVPQAFDTERLHLRMPRAGDGARLYEAVAASLNVLREFPASLPWAAESPSIDASELYCRESQSAFLARRDLPYLLLLRGTETVVGAVGLHRLDWTLPKCEIGWWGHARYHGRGLFTEAITGLMHQAVTSLGMRRIEALPDNKNLASIKLCERVGMTLEGVMRRERIDPDGTLRDTRVYAKYFD